MLAETGEDDHSGSTISGELGVDCSPFCVSRSEKNKGIQQSLASTVHRLTESLGDDGASEVFTDVPLDERMITREFILPHGKSGIYARILQELTVP